MYRQFECEYSAGGYPSPTYNGTITFGMNQDEELDSFEMFDLAKVRAKAIVGNKTLFESAMITINSVKLVN